MISDRGNAIRVCVVLLAVASSLLLVACAQAGKRAKVSRSIFASSFEGASLKPWAGVQAEQARPLTDSFQIVDSPVRDGRHAAEFIVRQGYSPFGWDESSELVGGPLDTNGEEGWYRFSILFPQGWEAPLGWGIFAQWHSSFDVAPPLDLNARGSTVELNVHTGLVAGEQWQFNVNRTLLTSLHLGQWNDFVVHVRWTAARDGLIEVWHRLAGQRRYARLTRIGGIPTLQYSSSQTSSNYFKLGLYRESTCPQPTTLGCTGSSDQPPSILYADAVRLVRFACAGRAPGTCGATAQATRSLALPAGSLSVPRRR